MSETELIRFHMTSTTDGELEHKVQTAAKPDMDQETLEHAFYAMGHSCFRVYARRHNLFGFGADEKFDGPETVVVG